MESNSKNFRVHSYQIYRVPYDVVAVSPEAAAAFVDKNCCELTPSGEMEFASEILPTFVVDPLSPIGEIDYVNVKNVDLRSAIDLRKEALVFLGTAAEMDGLQPNVVVHETDHGSSAYIAWCDDVLTEEMASSVLDYEFESYKGESLRVESSITLEELTGVSEASRIVSEKSLLASLEEAKALADRPGHIFIFENAADCKISGSILAVTAHHFVQNAGPSAVIYLKSDVDQVPSKGNWADISFKGGKGSVTELEGNHFISNMSVER